MCNLKKLDAPMREVAALFSAIEKSGNSGPGEVYPGQIGVVVTHTDGERTLQPMTWGFPLITAEMRVRAASKGSTPRPKPVNNARMDKMASPFWKRWFENTTHRCLIPITEFAEARGEPGYKTRVWFSLNDEPIFAWAGLWRDSNQWGKVYTGCMTEANDAIRPYHDRMPVLLERARWADWLTADGAAATQFRGLPSERILVRETQEPWVRR